MSMKLTGNTGISAMPRAKRWYQGAPKMPNPVAALVETVRREVVIDKATGTIAFDANGVAKTKENKVMVPTIMKAYGLDGAFVDASDTTVISSEKKQNGDGEDFYSHNTAVRVDLGNGLIGVLYAEATSNEPIVKFGALPEPDADKAYFLCAHAWARAELKDDDGKVTRPAGAGSSWKLYALAVAPEAETPAAADADADNV